MSKKRKEQSANLDKDISKCLEVSSSEKIWADYLEKEILSIKEIREILWDEYKEVSDESLNKLINSIYSVSKYIILR